MLSQRIREQRMKMGCSSAHLAELLGVSSAFVSQMESGKIMPSVEVMMKLADIFHISVAELLQDKRGEKPLVIRTEELLHTGSKASCNASLITPIMPYNGVETTFKILKYILAPGQAIHKDNTHREFLCFFCDKGEVVCKAQDLETILGSGDSIYIAECWGYTLENASDSDAVLFCVVCPIPRPLERNDL